jgi:hypothetical protein
MAQRNGYLEIDYRGWGHKGELYPDTLAQSAAAVVPVAAESRPVPLWRSLQQRIVALLSQNVVDLDPKYMLWMFTCFAIGVVTMAALLAVFIVTH